MKFIFFLVVMALSFATQAQTATATSGNMTATASAKVGTTNSKTTKTSVSVSISDNSYSLHAIFDSFKRVKLQKLLQENLDKSLLSTNDEKMIWRKENKGDTAYSFTLTDEKLKVSLDRELVSSSTFEKMKELGEKISELLNGN